MNIHKILKVILILSPIFLFSQKLEVIYKLERKSKKTHFYKLIIDGNSSDFYMIKNNQIVEDTIVDNNQDLIVCKRSDVVNFLSNEDGLKIKTPPQSLINWKVEGKSKKESSFDLLSAESEYDGVIWKGWYIKDMQIPDGPFVFKNLPGLLYSVSDEKNELIFELQSIKKVDNNLYDINNKDIKLVEVEKFKEYKTTQKNKDKILIEKLMSIVNLKDEKTKTNMLLFDPLVNLISIQK